MNTFPGIPRENSGSPLAQKRRQDAPTVRLPATPQWRETADSLSCKDSTTAVDAAAEDAYWASHFHQCSYIAPGKPYPEFRAAFRFGWESRRRLPDVDWDMAKPRLRAEWSADPANFRMSWAEAEPAVLDAWNHANAARAN